MNLNSIIRRKRYNDYLKDGVVNMRYEISEEFSKMAESLIIEDEINERLGVLKNQIKFFDNGKEVNSLTLSDDEVNNIKSSLNSINDSLDVLNFKKDNLEVLLNKALMNVNIKDAVKIKNEINEVEKNISNFNENKTELQSRLKYSEIDYESQMTKIREKYNGVDISKQEIDNEFSQNVIDNYKKETAYNLVKQFLDTLSEEKQKQILEQNEDLRGYVNVGENI